MLALLYYRVMPKYPGVIYFKTEEERQEANRKAAAQDLTFSQLGRKLYRELPAPVQKSV